MRRQAGADNRSPTVVHEEVTTDRYVIDVKQRRCAFERIDLPSDAATLRLGRVADESTKSLGQS